MYVGRNINKVNDKSMMERERKKMCGKSMMERERKKMCGKEDSGKIVHRGRSLFTNFKTKHSKLEFSNFMAFCCFASLLTTTSFCNILYYDADSN